MSEFFAVFKKEIKEIVRTKKLWLYGGLALAIVVFVFLIMGLMQALLSTPGLEIDEAIKQTFSLTYGSVTNMFCSFLAGYFVIAIIIFLRNYMSKEVKEKKWILPLESGIKPQNLILARLLAITLTIMSCVLLSILLHFVLCLIFCKPNNLIDFDAEGNIIVTQISKGESIATTLYNYAMIFVYILFFTIVILGINSATKKPALTVIIGLLLILVVDTILSSVSIKVGGVLTSLQSYTPFAFEAQALAKSSLHWSCWLSASLTTVGIIIAMVFLSLSSMKIKGEKIK